MNVRGSGERRQLSRSVGVTLAVFGLLAIACGSSQLPPAAADGTTTAPSYEGPCTVNGETRSCHVKIGQHGNVVDCFDGVQTCMNGAWSPCDGNGGTVHTRALPPEPAGGLSTLALSAPSPNANGCRNDPCNPNCQGYDELPPTPVKSTCAPTTYVAAGMCSISSTYWSDNAVGCTAGSVDDCFFGDTCCTNMTAAACGYTSATTNYCIARPTAGCGASPGCAGKVDYTAAPACDTPDGHSHEMICNRGTVDAPTSGSVMFAIFDSSDFRKECGGCGPGAAKDKFAALRGWCSIDLAAVSLKANACVDVDMTQALTATPPTGMSCTLLPGKNLSGAWGVYVNVAQKPAGTFAATCAGASGRPECNDCNNWSAMDVKAGAHPLCPSSGGSTTYTQTYSATCQPGFQPRWNAFGYNTVTPTGTSVAFAVQTGSSTAGPWTPAAPTPIATAPTDHPSVCTTAGPSPCGGTYPAPPTCNCPVSLSSALGANATASALNLTVTLNGGCAANPNIGVPQADICGLPGGCDGPKSRAQKDDPPTGCVGNNDCNYDTCCAQPSANKQCVQWAGAPKTGTCNPCTGVDYTVAVGCRSSGRQKFSICNRGTVDSPSAGTLKLGFNQGNPANPQVVPFATDKGACTINLATVGAIKAGGCIDIDIDLPTPGVDCSGASTVGNRFVVINNDGALAECNKGNNTSFNNGGICTPYNAPPGGQAQLSSFQVTYDCVPVE